MNVGDLFIDADGNVFGRAIRGNHYDRTFFVQVMEKVPATVYSDANASVPQDIKCSAIQFEPVFRSKNLNIWRVGGDPADALQTNFIEAYDPSDAGKTTFKGMVQAIEAMGLLERKLPSDVLVERAYSKARWYVDIGEGEKAYS